MSIERYDSVLPVLLVALCAAGFATGVVAVATIDTGREFFVVIVISFAMLLTLVAVPPFSRPGAPPVIATGIALTLSGGCVVAAIAASHPSLLIPTVLGATIAWDHGKFRKRGGLDFEFLRRRRSGSL